MVADITVTQIRIILIICATHFYGSNIYLTKKNGLIIFYYVPTLIHGKVLSKFVFYYKQFIFVICNLFELLLILWSNNNLHHLAKP